MGHLRSILIPHLVRLKSGALGRLSVYLGREGWSRVLVLLSHGLPAEIQQKAFQGCPISQIVSVEDSTTEWVESFLKVTESGAYDAVMGLGGGRALDVAKYVAYRFDLPYLAVPTSLSNDGFCSPNSSLTQGGKKVSLKARLPVGVVVDLPVVKGAPKGLWLSGVGDLVSKRTAIFDWKRAFHTDGTPFDDFAALLSDGSVYQFMAHPKPDSEGIRLLAQALLLNGVAMEVAGCSRPASGSEHLISHALDQFSAAPRPHGHQVGLATYWMALLQGQDVSSIDKLFERTGFWALWQGEPGSRQEWLQALEQAGSIKDDFVTVLDEAGARERAAEILHKDMRLRVCLSD